MRKHTRRLVPPVATLAVLLIMPARAVSQESTVDPAVIASAYIPLGSSDYPILEYWISAGRIYSLSPFTKPWRRIDVAAALMRLDEADLSDGETASLENLRERFAAEFGILSGQAATEARIDMEFVAGGEFVSQTHRDFLRPALEGEFSDFEFLTEVGASFEGTAGPIAGAVRARHHGIYREDAQFPRGEVVGFLTAFQSRDVRVEEGYVEVQTPYASISFGQLYRNWGAPNLNGFLRSDYAYSEPELGYRLGTSRVFLIGTFASYRDFKADTAHYVAIHRLEIRPSDRLMLGFSESSVHGGPGQGVDFRLVNPLSIWMLARSDIDPPHNRSGQVDVWWRASPHLTTYASLLSDASEDKLGGSLGFELPRLLPGFLLRLNLSFVQSQTYRARVEPPLPWEEYTVERIGIGWDKSDLYLVSLEGEWFPSGSLHLRPKLDIQVQGEGDIRLPRESPDELEDLPSILIGQTETTVRPGLAGSWRYRGRFGVELNWDVGLNVIRDFGHTAGDDRTEFVGALSVRVRTPRWGFGLD